MLNKLDILSGIDEICLCVAYEIDGRAGRGLAVERRRSWPARPRSTSASPAGASRSTTARTLAELPENARRYVSALETAAGVPIVLVSVGPERSQTIERAFRPMRRRAGPGPGAEPGRRPTSRGPGDLS